MRASSAHRVYTKFRSSAICALGIAAFLLASCTVYPPATPREQAMGAERQAAGEIPYPEKPGYAAAAPGAKIPEGSVKIGLLVPLTGPNAALGKSMQDAAVMAIFDKYDGLPRSYINAKVEVIPKDTGDTADQAALAAQEAIEEGAVLILGPVFGNQVPAVAPIARAKTSPVISFSNNMSVLSPGVYLFGFMPDQQVKRVVDFAIARKYSQIAGLAPSNPYGNTVMKQLSAQATAKGVRANPIEYYLEDASNLAQSVNRLAPVLSSRRSDMALLSAEGGDRLAPIHGAMVAAKISGMQIPLLGTGLWDNPAVMQYPTLQGGIFASADPQKNAAFEQRFSARFGYRPDRRSSLAYDATALAATLALSPNGADFSHAALTDPVGYIGLANGVFRFRNNGVAERALAILQINPNGFSTIEPAPTSFLK